MTNEPKKYVITVIVEREYSKVITANSDDEALDMAANLNIQDDEDNWDNTEVMEPIVYDESTGEQLER